MIEPQAFSESGLLILNILIYGQSILESGFFGNEKYSKYFQTISNF